MGGLITLLKKKSNLKAQFIFKTKKRDEILSIVLNHYYFIIYYVTFLLSDLNFKIKTAVKKRKPISEKQILQSSKSPIFLFKTKNTVLIENKSINTIGIIIFLFFIHNYFNIHINHNTC